MSNGVGTGDGPDAVWRQGSLKPGHEWEQGCLKPSHEREQGSLKPGHEWEQGCLPLKLIFYRIQGERLHRK